MKANVFEIQPFSIHDGPGIRTTVFLKGCPLHCRWCHNPESQHMETECLYLSEKCSLCGACIQVCPQKALWAEDGMIKVHKESCNGCGVCKEACPNHARLLSGQYRTVEEVMAEIRKDSSFFRHSGGGVTISGGEPLLFPDFTEALLKACKQEEIHTAVETSCYASREVVERALQYAELVFCDLKLMDSKMHQFYTGAANELILENMVYLRQVMKKDLVIRIPIVTGCNDTCENIERSAKFVKEQLGEEVPMHLLPYHKLGVDKQEQLSRDNVYEYEVPTEEKMEQLQKTAAEYLKHVQIGGSM